MTCKICLMNIKKHYTVKQVIKKANRNNQEIISCYEHFSLRYKERLKDDISYNDYFSNWIPLLRGYYLGEKKGMMFRMVGSYVKEEKIYKVIYKKITCYGIYVPITIYEISDHKNQFRMQMKNLKEKHKMK